MEAVKRSFEGGTWPSKPVSGRSSPRVAEEHFDFDGLGVHWKIDEAAAANRFTVGRHSTAPHALAAPLHRYTHVDAYCAYVRFGNFFQFVLPVAWGHLSVCIEANADPLQIGRMVKELVDRGT